MHPNIQLAINGIPSLQSYSAVSHTTTSEAAVLRIAFEKQNMLPPHQVGTMEVTWPKHQMTVLPYIYISFPQKLLFTQHRLLIVGNPKEQVKTPSLPTESQEMPGKAKTKSSRYTAQPGRDQPRQSKGKTERRSR